MSANGRHRKYHTKVEPQKTPEVETVLSKRLSVIVDNKHRPVFHKDGHFLIFPTRSAAERWYKRNIVDLGKQDDYNWRIERLDFLITKL